MHNKIRLAHVSSGDIWAGAESQLFNLVTGLQKQNDLEIYIVLFNPGVLEKKLESAGIKTIVLNESQLSPIQLLRKLRALFQDHKIEVIHSHGYKENILSTTASMGLGINKLKTVHGSQEHPFSFTAPHKYLIQKLDSLISRHLLARLIAVSKAMYEQLTKEQKYKSVSLVQNTIDGTQFHQRDIEQEDQAIRIAFVGRLNPVKRPDIFLLIVKQLKTLTTRPIIAEIYGDGPLRREVETQISELDLATEVVIKGFSENLFGSLVKNQFLVMCSDHEGLPMSLLEALHMRLIVIAHNVGGIPEVLGQGSAGLLIDDQDPNKFAETILELSQDEERRQALTKNIGIFLDKNFNHDSSIETYTSIYRSLIRDDKQ